MRRVPLFFVFVLVATLCGCQVRTTVDISAGTNGAGSITVQSELDASAAAAAPDLAQQLNTGDLKGAGWIITGPTKERNGDTLIRVHHGFASPAEANTLMSTLTGADGPFRGFHLTQQRSISAVETHFTGTVDLTKGIQSFGDDALAKRLGNSMGFDPNEVQKSLGVDWPATFPVEVVVHLPGGSITKSAPTPDSKGVWAIPYASVTPLSATGSAVNVSSVVFLILAVVLALGALLTAILWKSDNYRPQHRDGGIRARDLLTQPEGAEK